MSHMFGDVVQQGYAVPDIDAAMEHWLARGVGPFYIADIEGMDGEYYGKPIKSKMRAAFAYSGDQQIEVIQPTGTNPSIYGDYLKDHPDGGLQHLAVWVDNVDDAFARLNKDGEKFVIAQRYGDAHIYSDNIEKPGVMMQLMARSDFYEAFFAIVKKGAETWDGKTDPLRMIDFSSGKPVEKRYGA